MLSNIVSLVIRCQHYGDHACAVRTINLINRFTPGWEQALALFPSSMHVASTCDSYMCVGSITHC